MKPKQITALSHSPMFLIQPTIYSTIKDIWYATRQAILRVIRTKIKSSKYQWFWSDSTYHNETDWSTRYQIPRQNYRHDTYHINNTFHLIPIVHIIIKLNKTVDKSKSYRPTSLLHLIFTLTEKLLLPFVP